MVGKGIVMVNVYVEIKVLVDDVILMNDENGVVLVIEKVLEM